MISIAMLEASMDSIILKGITAMLIYYVYAYIRKTNGTPYYIGKGSGKRMFCKQHYVTVPKDKTKIVILETNLTEIVIKFLKKLKIKYQKRIKFLYLVKYLGIKERKLLKKQNKNNLLQD